MSLFRPTASFAMSAAQAALSIAFAPARLGYRGAVAVIMPLYSSPESLTDSCNALAPLNVACEAPVDLQLAVAACDEVRRFASTPPDSLFTSDSTPFASACSPVALDIAPTVTDETPSEPSPPSPPLSLASSIASRPSSPIFDEPAPALPETCALPRSFAYRIKVDALEAWLVLNFVRLPTGTAHAAARTNGLARIAMEETYELALDIAWNATKFQEEEHDRVARLRSRVMRMMDDFLDHSQSYKKRRASAHARPKAATHPETVRCPVGIRHTLLRLAFRTSTRARPTTPTFSQTPSPLRKPPLELGSRSRSRSRSSTRSHRSRPQPSDLQMRVRLNEAWKVDRQNAPKRLERLQKMELARRYQEAATMAGPEEAQASTLDDRVNTANLPQETAVVCSDWRLALEKDDDEYFAAPPVFDS